MPLESVMICVDNSAWMRNGDYIPTRIEAQSDAVSYVSSSKLNSNAETTVGLLSMAGQRIEVHTSPTRSVGQIMNALAQNLRIHGQCNVVSALKTAQLALKNRVNKNQRQRIILFVGSPITASSEELIKIGKQLKKNNVAVDAVNFGAENASNDNVEKLEALISTVNSADNSHLVNIPPGPHVLSDLVGTSAIVLDPDQIAAGAGAGGGLGGDMGIDESDPEMAMAIRMSMEEARMREGGAAAAPAATTASTTTPATTTATTTGDVDMNDDEAMLAQAIALSMQAQNEATTDTTMTDSTATNTANTNTTATTQPTVTTNAEDAAALNDPDFINSLLSSVPGVNTADLNVNNLLDEMNKKSDNKDSNKDTDKQSDQDKK